MRVGAVLSAVLVVAGCSGDDGGSSDDAQAVCGDGVRGGVEACDDGNNEDEDGCSATCEIEEEPPATLDATWVFETVDGGFNQGCPSNVDTMAFVIQPLDAMGDPVGQPSIDLFDCVDEEGSVTDLPPGELLVYLEARNGSTPIAQTFSEIVDVTDEDKIVDFTFYSDGGYFYLQWNLVGATTGMPLTCTSVPRLDGVGLIATLSGTAVGIDQEFDCDPQENTTDVLENGQYVLDIDAIDMNNQSIGTADAVTGTLAGLNQVVDIGLVTISITGQ